jgi:hypothetical protein
MKAAIVVVLLGLIISSGVVSGAAYRNLRSENGYEWFVDVRNAQQMGL